MKLFNILNKAYFKFRVGRAGVIASNSVLAQVSDLGSLGDRAGSQASSTESGFVQVVGFIGLVIFAVSGVKLFTDKNQQDGKGKLVSGLLGGIFLMSIYFWAAVTSNTLTDEGQSADDIKAVIKGKK